METYEEKDAVLTRFAEEARQIRASIGGKDNELLPSDKELTCRLIEEFLLLNEWRIKTYEVDDFDVTGNWEKEHPPIAHSHVYGAGKAYQEHLMKLLGYVGCRHPDHP